MKKNILLYGSSRSGKTTLSKLLNKKFNYNVIALDSFVSAFSRAIPQLDINHNRADGVVVNNLKPFLWEYINTINKSNNKKRDIFYCVEGAYYDINDLYSNKDNFIIVILAENLDSPKQYFDKMRKFDKEYDWTYKLSDEDLMNYANNLYKDNNRIIQFCKNNNMKYYDTSKNREDVFNQILQDLEYEINLTEDDYFEQVVIKYGELKIRLKSPTYLIDTIKKRFKGMVSISPIGEDYDYSVEFCKQTENYIDQLFTLNIPYMDYHPQFSVNNENNSCKVFFLDSYDKEAKKKIARNFITNLFIRLYQLKGALLLHCSCVEKDNNAVIIVGNANCGKTVTMLNLLDFGFNFITNDFLIVDKNDNRLEFLPSPQFIGIRRSRKWLELEKNKKYDSLKSEGYIRVAEDRIYMSPQDLISLNNVNIGNICSELKIIVIPQYTPNSKYCCIVANNNQKMEILDSNKFNNFIDYSSQENYDNDFYKINVSIRNKNIKNDIFNELINKQTYIVKQNESNMEKVGEFILKQLEE